MFHLLVHTAGSTSVNHYRSNALWIVIGGIAILVVVAVILCFTMRKPKNGREEDERFYLREIRNYVRIIAIIIVAWAIISLISWILALISI